MWCRLRRAQHSAVDEAQRRPVSGLRHPGPTIELAIPKLRRGSYFPEWLLEPRRRTEPTLTQVICQCYVEEVSTRRVDDIRTLGIDGTSKSQVSELAKSLDVTVEAFRTRPLDAGPTPTYGSTG